MWQFLNPNLYPKLKDNRTVSFNSPWTCHYQHLCVHHTIKVYDTMKIQFAYYLIIIAAAAGVNAALASVCIYDCQDPDASASCGGRLGTGLE
ncbi:hypothetical protein BDR06DRAFT_175006 [Suillus hirtellus]|nr:hypothetical protein BDR06DRAFT_175006 [Suillus hirtellus]